MFLEVVMILAMKEESTVLKAERQEVNDLEPEGRVEGEDRRGIAAVAVVRELLMVAILDSKKCKNELQSSEEAATVSSGGLKSLVTVEKR